MTPIRTLAPSLVVRILAIVLIALFVAKDLRLVSVPSVRRQVPQSWVRRFGLSNSYFLYGLVLGAGILTFVPYAAVLSLIGLLSLQASLSFAIAGGACLGVGRTVFLSPLSRAASRRSLTDLLPASYRHLPRLSAAISVLALVAYL